MLKSRWLHALAALLITLAASTLHAQTTLLSDDFNDGVLNSSLWTTDTQPMFFWGGRTVTETGGAMFLANKGYLITSAEYDPVALGGIRVSGIWEAKSANDVLNVVTRANAIPTINFLNVDKGITCRLLVFGNSGQIKIERLEGGSSNPPGGLLALGFLKIDVGDRFMFEVVDDGNTVTFSVAEIGGDGVVAQVFGSDPVDNLQDFVVFHDRESGYSACLDDVTIESLQSTPEDIVAEVLETIAELELPKGISNALSKKLSNALQDLAAGEGDAAASKLGAFINQVEAQAGKKIPQAEAEALISSAEEAILLITES